MSDLLRLLPNLLRYEVETGKLFWLPRPVELFRASTFRHRTGKVAVRPAQWSCDKWNSRFAGKEAFTTVGNNGYLRGTVFYEELLAHRVIWAIVHAAWPKDQIDHINGNRIDNRLSNLREVSHAENCRNMARPTTNKSGVVGVSWDRSAGKWASRIYISGKAKHLGYFENFEDAAAARKEAEVLYGYHRNHGRPQSRADQEIAA